MVDSLTEVDGSRFRWTITLRAVALGTRATLDCCSPHQEENEMRILVAGRAGNSGEWATAARRETAA